MRPARHISRTRPLDSAVAETSTAPCAGGGAEGVSVVNGVDAATALAEELNYKEIFIIGGGEIYMIAFDRTNKIYMTRVHTEIEGDTYFPVIEKDDWTLVSKTDNPADEKHAYAFSFQLWERKSN